MMNKLQQIIFSTSQTSGQCHCGSSVTTKVHKESVQKLAKSQDQLQEASFERNLLQEKVRFIN